jgi:hypothetical protein
MTTTLAIAPGFPAPGIGHNQPPIDPTPFQIAEKAVNDIYAETTAWLDGKAIDSQEMADGIANLLAMIRKAEKLADETREAENAPFNAGKAEVQARYFPLIGDTKAGKGKTVLAAIACKAALQPWLDAEARRIKAEAAAKREEADRQRDEAEAALRASDATDLAAREAAETLLSDARKAETAANVAGRQTATAGGTFGRSAGLRTTWRATISDEVAAAKSCWQDPAGRAAMLVFLEDWANSKVRNERVRTIPGFVIAEERSVA